MPRVCWGVFVPSQTHFNLPPNQVLDMAGLFTVEFVGLWSFTMPNGGDASNLIFERLDLLQLGIYSSRYICATLHYSEQGNCAMHTGMLQASDSCLLFYPEALRSCKHILESPPDMAPLYRQHQSASRIQALEPVLKHALIKGTRGFRVLM